MTMSEATAIEIPNDETTDMIEELPLDAIAEVEEQAEVKEPIKFVVPAARHLASGSSTKTFCGLDRVGQTVAHPSKARKDDCLDCRTALRESMRAKTIPVFDSGPTFKKGDRIAYEDGSVWMVEDLRDGGADLACILASKNHAKGRRTTVSKDAALRVLDDAAFAELETASKPVKEITVADGTTLVITVRKTGKWAPTKRDVELVKGFRALGHNYRQIETDMEWPSGNGNRPWKIMKMTAEEIAQLAD